MLVFLIFVRPGGPVAVNQFTLGRSFTIGINVENLVEPKPEKKLAAAVSQRLAEPPP